LVCHGLFDFWEDGAELGVVGKDVVIEVEGSLLVGDEVEISFE